MSNLVKHAEYELERIGMGANTKDEMNRMMHNDVMGIVKLFSTQGHSGGSAAYAIAIVTKLLNFEPIGALTGADDEWVDVSETIGRTCWMNKRCSRILKEADGKCYDVEGRIFKDPDGSSWVNRDSWVEITFPYVPKHEYIEREYADQT